MRRSEFRQNTSGVVCALAVLLVSSNSFGQTQRLPTDADPQIPSFEPSAFGGLASGTDGTTPILHESAKLTASDADGWDMFGSSTALSGDTVLVGAWTDDCALGSTCGSAYVYRFNGTNWIEEQKLTASDAAPGDWFGSTTSVRGDTAVVGASRDDCDAGVNCGAAYIFRFNGTNWIEEQKLTASDAGQWDQFGRSVIPNGNTIVVGALGDKCASGIACGAAYVFRFDGTSWLEEQKLTPTTYRPPLARFASSISVSGDVMLVSASGQCSGSYPRPDCGSAYVFRFNGTAWVEEQRLTATDAARADHFGNSVSISGDVAVVGARTDGCQVGDWCGSVYVFRFNGTRWTEEQKLTATDAAPDDMFGTSVSVIGDMTVIGASRDACSVGWHSLECGSAYIYRFNGTSWVEEQKLAASDTAADDHFGTSVSMSEELVVVGTAPWFSECIADRACGAVYVFHLDEVQVTIDIKPGSDVNPVNLSSRGVLPVAVLTTSVADGDLIDFDAANVDPSSLTLAGAAPQKKGRRGRVSTLEDVDGDGDLDLVVHFPIPELDLTEQDTEAVLLGQTFDGTPIRGSDTIKSLRIHRFRLDDLPDGK